MADKNDLKRLLRIAARKASKPVSERQLTEATDQLALIKKASTSDLRVLGESVANDAHIFAASDIDEINTVLDTLRR